MLHHEVMIMLIFLFLWHKTLSAVQAVLKRHLNPLNLSKLFFVESPYLSPKVFFDHILLYQQ